MSNLPQGWVECELKDIGEIVSGGTPSTSNPNNFGGNIAWLTPADLSNYQDKYISQGSRNITELGLNSSSAKLMPAGAVLFSSRAPIGYTAIAKNPICTNQGFKNIVLFDGIYNEFVYYFLKNAKAIAEKFASGTTFKEISGSKFGQIPIKIPPFNEQKRIVEKIETEFKKIDKGIEYLEKAKEQITQYRKSVLYAAFNGNLYKSKAGWKEFELKDVCKNISAGGDKPEVYSETETELCKIPIYSNGIQNDGLYGYTNIAKIFEPAVTVSARGTIGFVCVRNQPYLPIVRLISVIPDTSILNIEFLKYFLNYIVPKGEGSSIPQLTVPNFKKYIITLPSLEEQQKIVEEIEKRFFAADEAEKIIDENLEKAKQLKQSILKKAFEGKLVSQDPNDEPASILLERIKSEREKNDRK